MKCALAIVGLILLSCAPALAAAPDVEAGRKVALKACSGCHAIDRGRSPAPDAPPFRTLYQRMDVNSLPQRFQDGMMLSHGQMPIARLGADEIAYLTAYMKSLGPMGSRPDETP